MKNIFTFILVINFCLMVSYSNIYADDVYIEESYDEFTQITWYTPESDEWQNIYVYIGVKEELNWMRLVVKYNEKDWIFFESVYLLYDQNVKKINFDYSDKESKVSDYGYVLEYIDISINDDLINYLDNFSKADVSKMRLSGQFNKDIVITDLEKKGIRLIIDKYKEINKIY